MLLLNKWAKIASNESIYVICNVLPSRYQIRGRPFYKTKKYSKHESCIIIHSIYPRKSHEVFANSILNYDGMHIPSRDYLLHVLFGTKTYTVVYSLYSIVRTLIVLKSSFTGSPVRKIVLWVDRGRYEYHESKSRKKIFRPKKNFLTEKNFSIEIFFSKFFENFLAQFNFHCTFCTL